MSAITRFSVRSNGRNVDEVRRPGGGGTARRQVVVTPAPAAAAASVETPLPAATIDESDYTKAELIDMAEARGLDSSGNKGDIVARLNG